MLINKKGILSFILLIFLASCVGGRGSRNYSQGPKWTHMGAGAYTINGVRVLRTVGSSADWGNPPLNLRTAKNNAAANLSYYMKTYVDALRTSYKKSQSQNGKVKNFEKTLVYVEKVLTKHKFSGLQKVKEWKSPKDGTLYVMLELRLDYVDEVVTRTIQDENTKKHLPTNLDDVRRRSAEAHKRLDEATADLGY